MGMSDDQYHRGRNIHQIVDRKAQYTTKSQNSIIKSWLIATTWQIPFIMNKICQVASIETIFFEKPEQPDLPV